MQPVKEAFDQQTDCEWVSNQLRGLFRNPIDYEDYEHLYTFFCDSTC